MSKELITVKNLTVRVDEEIYEEFKKKFEFKSDNEALTAIFSVGYEMVAYDLKHGKREGQA